ncbi:MAG TPA: AMP-binding protein, partial [Steroidobacteraceae bacterium]|nr:AMP-binding protein [Steroidobacteraceae bacterium]
MTAGWTPDLLLQRLAARGAHPAVIASSEAGVVTTSSAALAADVAALARRLRAAGIGAGGRVALCGPNGVDWITAALAVLACGGVLVPIDEQSDVGQFAAALRSSNARLLVASAARLAACTGPVAQRLQLDEWRTLPEGEDGPLPASSPDAPALLSWTSGTTGNPKAFLLTLHNIGSNVEAIEALHIAGVEDRALLPLPLHHAYPFVAGVLSTLSIGTAIVLPAAPTGPLIVRALRDGEATAIVGVPRLYEAILAVLEARFAKPGRLAALAWRGALAVATRLERRGLHAGRLLFRPVRSALAPRLRL